MKNILQKVKRAIVTSIICFFFAFSSLSFLIYLPRVDEINALAISYSVAIIFWGSLIYGFVFCFRARLLVKKHLKNEKIKNKLNNSKKLGIFSFSKSITHVILYLIFLVGITLILFDLFQSRITSSIMIPVISVTMFSFALHCIVDGANYKIYKQMKEGRNNV